MTNASQQPDDLSSQTVMLSLARLSRLAQEARLSPAASNAIASPRSLSQVVRLRAATGTLPPLVLFHPAGGSIVPYRILAKTVSSEREVLGVQCHLDSALNTLRHNNIGEVAADYGQQIAAVHPLKGVVLGGYSMGGMIAFELACQLQRRGIQVGGVILMDTPSQYAGRAQSGEPVTANGLLFFAHMLAGREGKKLTFTEAELAAQEPSNRIAFVLEHLRAQGMIESNANVTLFEEIYHLVRHNELLARGFRPGCFVGPVSLIRTQDHVAEFVEETCDLYADPDFGWAPYCTRPVQTIFTPGHHFNVLYAPHVQTLARNLRSVLEGFSHERSA